MFGRKEFEIALQAYKQETTRKGRDDFTALRKSGKVFEDVKTKESVEEQVKAFIDIISTMNRDDYPNRYVIQTFLLDFCRYLDKDFLFSITTSDIFFKIKEQLKVFTGEIYETNKKFTQNVALHSLEHLLENYGSLLKFADMETSYTTYADTSGGSVWSGNRLW